MNMQRPWHTIDVSSKSAKLIVSAFRKMSLLIILTDHI